MKFLLSFVTLLMLCGSAFARTLTLENVICNPGAAITLPLTIDDVSNIASVYVQINYDPLVLVFTGAEQGDLKSTFSSDFIIVEEPGNIVLLTYASSDAKTGGGTLAKLNFIARSGSQALYSDVTIADIRLQEHTHTRDLTATNPVQSQHALIRSLNTDASCTDRMGANNLRIAEETTLDNLTLKAGDTLSVSNDGNTPIVITNTLSLEGSLRLAAPSTGWTSNSYNVLTCSRNDVTFTDIPEGYTLSTTATNNQYTYLLTANNPTNEIPLILPEGIELAAIPNTAIYTLLGEHLTDTITAIQIEGTQEAILSSLYLGIQPLCTTPATRALGEEASTLIATFYSPTLKVKNLDLQNGRVEVQVIPAAGTTITQEAVKGAIHLHAGSTLANIGNVTISEDDIDLTSYLTENNLMSIDITLQLGSNAFFKVVIDTPNDASN